MIDRVYFLADLPIAQHGAVASRLFDSANGWTIQVEPTAIRLVRRDANILVVGVPALVYEAPAVVDEPPKAHKKGTKKP